MASTCQISDQRRLIEISFTERLAAEELDSLIATIASDGSHLPGYRILIDTSDTIAIPRSGEVPKIANVIDSHQDVFSSKTAIVLRSKLHREMMEIVLVLVRAKTKVQIELFGDIEPAMEWLDGQGDNHKGGT